MLVAVCGGRAWGNVSCLGISSSDNSRDFLLSKRNENGGQSSSESYCVC